MLKLIATNGGMTLFQTGFTVVFEGTFLEESFPSGHIIDEEGELIPVPKIDSVINSPYWSVIEMPDEPLGKGRKRQFASRAEAGRYAARIRWGNTAAEIAAPTGNPLPVAATFDINEAIATGAPYAPFLEENFPDDVKNALTELELSGETNGIGPASQKALMALEIHYEKHLDPKNFSAETQETSRLAGEKGNSFYSQFSVVPDIDRSAESRNIYRAKQRKDLASDMAREHVKLHLERKYVKDAIGEEDALAYTKAIVASPSMRIAVAVHGVSVIDILNNGFKNQFETGESSGMNNPARRATHEAIAYGIHPATVASKRPIYANLHPVGTQVTDVNGSRQYGSVQFVVKQSVHDRATFSVTDSLGQVRNAASVKGPIKQGQAHPNGIQKGTYNDPIHISKRAQNGESYPYAEAQIQQGLKISDIAYVAIPRYGRLPNGAPALLKKLGIKVVRIDDRDPLNDSAVIKSATVNLQQTLDLISEVVAKAQSFGGNRSAAGQYAAQVRWGKKIDASGVTPSATPSYNETVVRDETSEYGGGGFTRRATITFQNKNDAQMTMYVKSQGQQGEQSVMVELRKGGTSGPIVGRLDAVNDHGNFAGGNGKLVIVEVAVDSKQARKGYATAMMRLGSKYSIGSEKIVHSTVLTDDGAGFAAAVKSRLLEKGRKRKFSSRAEAAAYAANIRWANNRADSGNEPPHMREMRLEAEALRGEMDILNQTVSFDDMKRTSLRINNPNNPQAWTDEKGDIQINSKNEEMIPSPRLADLHDRVSLLGHKMHQEALDRTTNDFSSTTTADEAHEIYAGHMKAVLSEVRPVGGPIELTMSGTTDPKDFAVVRSTMTTVSGSLPRDWTAESTGARLEIKSDLTIDNGSFSPPRYVGEKPAINIPTQGSMTMNKRETLDVVGHEYTHFIEHRRPAVRALEVAFMTHRTTGVSELHNNKDKSAPSLRSRIKTGTRDSRSHAKATSGHILEIDKDRFVNLYSGRRYDSAVKTIPPYSRPNNSRSGFFELMSTGMEQVLNGNRGNFDYDHMGFVLGVMATA